MSTPERRFADKWAQYFARCVPRGAGQVQQSATRRAFYSGGFAAFLLLTMQLDEGAEATEKDLQMVDDLKAEFDAFVREMADPAPEVRPS